MPCARLKSRSTFIRWLAVIGWLVALATPPPHATAQPAAGAEAIFPFVLPWDDASPGITDLSGWLHAPAGSRGRVRIGEDAHFYAGSERIRFLGVNVSFAGGMPSKADAPKIAGDSRSSA
jgi:hypothetical protein